MTGRVGGSAGTVIFAISIDGNGAVTVAQYTSLKHPTSPDSYDEAVNLAGLLNAVVTVTDGDGDVATGTVAIGDAISFEDDGPSADIALTGTSAVLDELLGADPADLNAGLTKRCGQSVPADLRHADWTGVERRPGGHHDSDRRRRRRRHARL